MPSLKGPAHTILKRIDLDLISCEIIPSQIPVPAMEKIKNEQLHVGRALDGRRSVTSL